MKTNPKTANEKKALTVQEAANLLNVSTSYVYKLCRNRTLPVLNTPGIIRIDRVKFFKWTGATDPLKAQGVKGE
jgi:excisionase family DNA binding protein